MKKQKEQKHENGWCKQCRKVTKFVTHADFSSRWICTTRGCYHQVDELEKEPARPSLYKYWKPNTSRDMYL